MKPRASIEEYEDRLVLTVPSPGLWFGWVFFLGWLVGWCFTVGLLAYGLFSQPRSVGGFLFLIVGIIAWSSGMGFVGYLLAWFAFGHDSIEINKAFFRRQRKVLGFTWERVFPVSQVRNLRLEIPKLPLFGWERQKWDYGLEHGLLCFEVGSTALRFGGSISEREARAVLEQILTRFPQYGARHDLPSGSRKHSTYIQRP